MRNGQALVEWALLFPLYALLWVGLFVFAEWFLIHQNLLMAAKEGAFLYSSGRLKKQEVEHRVQKTLKKGFPALDHCQIIIQRRSGATAALCELEEIHVRYRPSRSLLRYFANPLEETCVIKHAPRYRSVWPVRFGPPVKW